MKLMSLLVLHTVSGQEIERILQNNFFSGVAIASMALAEAANSSNEHQRSFLMIWSIENVFLDHCMQCFATQ